VLGLEQEVGEVSSIELGLKDHTPLEQSFASLVEGPVQQSQKDGSFLAQDLFGIPIQRAEDVDIVEDSCSVGSHCLSLAVVDDN
jgi:hypothetical protein